MASNHEGETSFPLDRATALAQQRTELALERTLLAWVRTAFAFISAAVAINRVLFAESTRDFFAGSTWTTTAWTVSMLLSLLTTLLLAIATVEYVQQCKYTAALTGQRYSVSWPSLMASALVFAIGVVASLLLLLS